MPYTVYHVVVGKEAEVGEEIGWSGLEIGINIADERCGAMINAGFYRSAETIIAIQCENGAESLPFPALFSQYPQTVVV